MDARELAVRVLDDVDRKGAYANQALDRWLSEVRLESRERALATEIVYGTLRNRGYIDWAIDSLTPRGVGSIDTRLLNVLRTAVYQIRFLTRIPPFAAVNEAVSLGKRLAGGNAHRFLNGVLRAYVRRAGELVPPSPEDDPVRSLSIRYSFPAWMIERWLAEYGLERAALLCEYLNANPPLVVRVNSLRADRADVAARLLDRGVQTFDAPHTDVGLILERASAVDDIPEFVDGLITVQDVSSMLVAPVVSPKPGDLVIDACAGPGGKTTHLAELMRDRGRVISIDVHEHKLADIEDAACRLGLSCIETRLHDATQPIEDLDGLADAVLVDAPCSGLGVLNRRADARWRKTPQDIADLVELQSAILHSVSRCVKVGGALVYSTCTITHEENDGVIERFLAEHSDFSTLPIAPYLPSSLVALGGLRRDDDHSIRILPFAHGIDGFFIARLTRIS